MRVDTAMADRKQSVRNEAQEWMDAGWIGREAFQRIQGMYADDRVRAGITFRTLFFILTLAAILGILGPLYIFAHEDVLVAIIALFAGATCWGIGEYLILSKRRRQGGIEAAFSAAAVINLAIGLAILIFKSHAFHGDSEIGIVLFILFLLAGAAGWNWGYWPYMVFSAGLLYFCVQSLPEYRLIWMVLVICIYPWLVRGWNSPSLPPSQRKCCAAFLLTSIVASYAAVNIFLADHHDLELFHRTAIFPRWLHMLLTAILPTLVFATGAKKRRRHFLVLGFLLGLLSLVTMRFYVHVAPLWMVLTVAGILLLACAETLRRYLDSGADKERGGYAASPLAARPGKHRGVEILASVATLTPDASPASENPRYHGGGGEFGGGGASGNF